MVKCEACEYEKEAVQFEANILRNHLHDERKAVCMECVECGYSPHDVRPYHGHVVKSGGILYGCPLFLTFTPSERHGMLNIHLFRLRRNDTAL